jgi:hypothetical protein
MNEEEEKSGLNEDGGEIVEFPVDSIRMPPQRLPQPIGRIAPGHPLQKPLTIAIWVLGLGIALIFVGSILSGMQIKSDDEYPLTFSEMYREAGAITYDGEIITGWFLDIGKQHFMDEEGKRFTYVDSHSREGQPVSGHWRLVE